MPVKVLTDHKGLKYFMTTKKLTPRQARWAEFLSEFNFVVTYQSRKKNDKANALTKRPNERPMNDEDERQKHRMQVLLLPERIKIQPIEVSEPQNEPSNEPQHAEEEAEELGRSHAAESHAKPEAKPENSTKATRNESMEAKHEEPEEETKEAEERSRSNVAEPQPGHKGSVGTKDLQTLPDQVKESNRNNSLFTKICQFLASPGDHERPTDVYLRGSRTANGLLYKDSKLWVSDDLRLDVI